MVSNYASVMLFDNATDKITANYVELTKLPINAILGALHMPKKFGYEVTILQA